jgi:hypothetical protein
MLDAQQHRDEKGEAMNVNGNAPSMASEAPNEPVPSALTEAGNGQPEQIEVRRSEAALEAFITQSRKQFDQRFPGIGYDSDIWDFKAVKEVARKKISLQRLHNTNLVRITPGLVVNELSELHFSFSYAARALLASGACQNKGKGLASLEGGLGLFKYMAPKVADEMSPQRTLADVTIEDLREIEKAVVKLVKVNGPSAERQRSLLHSMYRAIELLQSRGVVARMNVQMSLDVKDELGRIMKEQEKAFREQKAAELDPGIAALSDAIVEMVDENPLLSMIHKAALCVMGLEMCAPSRINEVMTLSTNDRLVSSTAYEDEPQLSQLNSEEDEANEALKNRRDLHRAHAEIKSTPDVLLTMKGSKGAAWGPKPILNFMTEMFNECFDRLIQYGRRSRMLVSHYEQNPRKLYLPPDLEHLRGKVLDRRQVGQIIRLDASASDAKANGSATYVMRALVKAKKTFTREQAADADFASSDRKMHVSGKLVKVYKQTLYCRWEDIEEELLRRVHGALDSLRWITQSVRYEGKLSNMLLLHDGVDMTPPYLPSALCSGDVRVRLKARCSGSKTRARTVFELLNITMPVRVVDGKDERGAPARYKEVVAYVSPHDPRRWLTTQALRLAGPQLSKVVLSKWANRRDLSQVDSYDYAGEEEKARRSVVPMPDGVNELESFSSALGAFTSPVEALQREYGLNTRLLTSGTRTVEVTTLSEVRRAVENRPVAKAGGKLIILYPTQYGVCLHQHHERACTAFNGCGTACNAQTFVKGDLPSNEATRRESDHLHAIVVAQIRPLVLAHTRGVAHDPASLEEHIMALIKPHMSVEDIATRLIEEFHEYKHVIKDAAFRARLEDAHVFHGVSKLLDDPNIASGALIKYDNPARHGSPELERSIESLGGRNGIAESIEAFNSSSPWFAPLPMNGDEIGRMTRGEEGAANDEVLLDEDDSDEDEAQGI